MKKYDGEINLRDQNILMTNRSVEFSISVAKDFELEVTINPENPESLEELLSRNDEIKDGIESTIHSFDEYSEDFIETAAYFETYPQELLDNVEWINIDFNEINIHDYLVSNPIILTKKVFIEHEFELTDYKDALKLSEDLDEFRDKIYVKIPGCKGRIPLVLAIDIMKKINDLADYITEANLSPAETVMYAYDLVRDFYTDPEKQNFNQQDLRNIFFKDDLNQTAYNTLLINLLNILGFNAREVIFKYKESNTGEYRTILYLRDKKYGIDGIYTISLSSGIRKSINNNKHYNTYRYFLKTPEEMINMDKNATYMYQYPFFEKDMAKTIIDSKEKKSIGQQYRDYFQILNRYASLLGEDTVVNPVFSIADQPFFEYAKKDATLDYNDICKRTNEIEKKLNSPITGEQYIDMLINVKKEETRSDSDKFRFDMDYIYSVYENSKWELVDNHLPQVMSMMEIDAYRANKRAYTLFNYLVEEKMEDLMDNEEEIKMIRRIIGKK